MYIADGENWYLERINITYGGEWSKLFPNSIIENRGIGGGYHAGAIESDGSGHPTKTVTGIFDDWYK